MAATLRNTIVVAMGAGALGGPEALRLLLPFAGGSPLVDILIVVFVITAVTVPALGTMLLARFFRKLRAGAGAGGGRTGAAVDDPFAKMTLAVSLAVAVLVSATLILLPLFQSGDLGALAFAGAALVVGACAARVRGVLLPNAHGAAPATERFAKATLMVSVAAVCFLVPCVAVGMLDAPAQRLLAFAFKNPLATVPVGVATATGTVIGATVIAFFFRKAQNADAAAAAAAAPTMAMELFHNHKMNLVMITPFVVAFFLVACLLAAPPVA